ncbi:family 43 glycosylhydrolase [Aerococcaceae bacterium zg-ZUI334]|uniref:glycoside hydrolase family 43 protein n=1 Tax=Aerococcaceae bacterium zg-252 TaxID=2796928 RepID=UPI001B8F9487|nr:family 43 glycosylhydrolase [Aerococcaceae bacterium zg-ZUI334]
MKREAVNIRDPYVVVHNQMYYLYGTRSETTWSDANGFDCYTSSDLENWDGPIEIFKRSDEFFATQNYWAPEVYYHMGEFYFVTTFGAKGINKGIYMMKSAKPTGPFELISGRLTPADWSAIDGTLYFEDGKNYLIFSHSFETSPDGDMCVVELSKDLTQTVTQPQKLFSAAEAVWAQPIPFAKAEFGLDGDVYFTDGPSLFKDEDGELYMLWSSWGTEGYAVGLAVSESGKISGPWKQISEPIFNKNGGHAMIFEDLRGKKRFTYHSPNDMFHERLQFADLVKENGTYVLKNRTDNQ